MARRRRRLKLLRAAYLWGKEDALSGKPLWSPMILIYTEEVTAYCEGFFAGEAEYETAMQAMSALAGTHDYRVEGVK